MAHTLLQVAQTKRAGVTMRLPCIAAIALLAVCLATGRRKKTTANAGAVLANAAPGRAAETSGTADEEPDVGPLIEVYLKQLSEYLATRLKSQADAVKYRVIVKQLSKSYGFSGLEDEELTAKMHGETAMQLEGAEKRTSDYRYTLHQSLNSIALTLALQLRDLGALDIAEREQAIADGENAKFEECKGRQEAAQRELELAAKILISSKFESRDVKGQAEQAQASFMAASSKVLDSHRDLELAHFRAKLAKARAEAARGALADTCAVRVGLERGLGSIATGVRIYFNMEYQAVQALDTLDTEWDNIEAKAHSQIAAFRDEAAKEKPAKWSIEKGKVMHHSVTQLKIALTQMHGQFLTVVSGLGFGRRRLYILAKALIHFVETGFAASLGVEPTVASLLSPFLEFATPTEPKDPPAPGGAPVVASANGANSIVSNGHKRSAASGIQQKSIEDAKMQPAKPSKKKSQRNANAPDPTVSGQADSAKCTSNAFTLHNDEGKQSLAAAFKIISTIETQSGFLQSRTIMPGATSPPQSPNSVPAQSPRGKSTRLVPNQAANMSDHIQEIMFTAKNSSNMGVDSQSINSRSDAGLQDERRADRETRRTSLRPPEVSHDVIERTIAAAVPNNVNKNTVKVLSDLLQNSIEGVFSNHVPDQTLNPVPQTHNLLKPFFKQCAYDFAITIVEEMRKEAQMLRKKERDAAISLAQTLTAKEEADTALAHFSMPYLVASGRHTRSREVVEMDARLCVLAAQATLAVARAERIYMELRVERTDCEVMCTLDGVLSLLGLDDKPLVIDSMLAQSPK